jgi:tetratricopeptide (TPR) repeat protein
VTAIAPSTSAPPAGALRRVAAVLPFVPAFVVAATWVVWATDGGGYFPIARYPGALLAAGLLLTIALARPPGAVVRSPALLPLGLLAAWTAWNGLSVAWTGAPDTGWESTNELLAVVVMGAVMVVTPWRPRSAMALLVLWASAIAVIATVDLVTFAAASSPGGRLLESRYLGPIGYANGTAALGAMAFWPLLAVASGPRFGAAARIIALPAAVVVLAWALLPQSRGTMLAGFAVLPLFVALSSHRVRVLTRLVVVAGALVIAVPALFDVYTASRQKSPLDNLVETAMLRTAIAAAIALVASVLLVAAERRVRPGEQALRRIRRAGVASLVLVLLAGATVAVASHERISTALSDRWDTFSSNADAENTQTGARIGQVVADKRYDYWTVALDAFRERPVVGIGAGGFENRYAAHKRYAKHSRYAHNLWLRTLSETGVVGLALLLAALATGLATLVRIRRRAAPEAYPAIAAAAALGTAFFLQCSLDWLEEVPALVVPAICLPLAVMRAAAPVPARAMAWGVPAAAVLAVVAVIAMTPPYLAVRHIERGDDVRVSDPRAALESYDRAAAVNPLAVQPYLDSGFVGLNLHDAALARRSFERALGVREDWLAHFELGLLDSQAGRRASARGELQRAARLNRNDPIVTDALAAVEEGKRLDPLDVNRQVLEQPVLAAPP